MCHVVEHSLSKRKVVGSIPTYGSFLGERKKKRHPQSDLSGNRTHNLWDWAFLAIFIGLIIQIVMFSFATQINIAFYWIMVIIDLPDSRPELVRQTFSDQTIVSVSAKTGDNIEALYDAIIVCGASAVKRFNQNIV